jgi:ribosome maturation factor RimP
MILVTRLEKLLAPVLAHQELDLVRVQLSGQHRPTLQIMIDRLDETAVTIEDCTGASREISALLDVEDLIEGSYKLEVTSPGLDRPLIKIRDFQRFIGHEIKFQTCEMKEGRKKFTGILEKADEKSIQVRLNDKEAQSIEVTYSDIQQAKLVPQF